MPSPSAPVMSSNPVLLPGYALTWNTKETTIIRAELLLYPLHVSSGVFRYPVSNGGGDKYSNKDEKEEKYGHAEEGRGMLPELQQIQQQ